MKKLFVTLSIIALAIGGAFAQKVTFPTDNKGRICYTKEFETELTKAELIEDASTWAVTTFHASDAVFSKDEAKGELLVNGAVKSGSAYNPFAGTYNEYVNFVIKFNVQDGKVAYTLYRPTLTETYSGYGTNAKTTNMDDMYISYVQAFANIKDAKENPSISKKDQRSIIRDAEKVIHDYEESLQKASIVIGNVTKDLEKALSR